MAAVGDSVYVGRAAEDGIPNQGWLLGHFMPEGDLLHSRDVEVKWGVHPPGDRRAAWATDETRTALLVLIKGAFDIELRDRTVVLRSPGDYVVWGPGRTTRGAPVTRRPSCSPCAGLRCRAARLSHDQQINKSVS